MCAITADVVASHDNADDDAEGSEDEEGDSKRDLTDWGLVLDDVWTVHHDVLVADREGMVDVRHRRRRRPRRAPEREESGMETPSKREARRVQRENEDSMTLASLV